ncbi:MAG: hypothetical protein RL324_171 [Verrucomicrobiota bacterium]
MLHRPQRTRTRLRQLTDGVLFVVAFIAAYFLRAGFPWFDLSPLEPFADYLRLLPAVAVLGPVILHLQGFYDSPRAPARLAALFLILRSCTFTVLGLIAWLFILREQLARSVIILVGGFAGLLLYLRDEFTAWLDGREFALAQFRRRVLWVGRPAENTRLRAGLTRADTAGLEDAGDFDPAAQADAEFVALLHERAPNVVILNLAGLPEDASRRILRLCGHEGIEVLVRPGLAPLETPRLTLDRFGGEPVFYYRAQAASPVELLLKQVLDYVGGAILLLGLTPLIGLVALAIRLSSSGPVLYRQSRAGLNGRPFTMFKFRSMTVGAEHHQEELAGRNEMRGPVFKVSDDPRVTTLGRFLRRHSLDELPQLWNVIRGEMSLVGPRPLPIEEVKRFDDDTHRRRLSVRPGLTCLWQISGRNDIADFTDWVRLDLQYIDEWSLWLDVKILLATVPVALLGKGGR